MKTVKQIEEAGRQVVMAGLGIVGLSKDFAVHKLDALMEDFNGFVNELLTRGESVEQGMDAKNKMQSVKDRRIAQIRKQLGLGNDPHTSELDHLSHKLDELTRVVNKLAEQKTATDQKAKAVPAKAPTKRAPRAKATTTKAASTSTAKKAAAQKTTARKTTTATKAKSTTTRAKKATGATTATTPRANTSAKTAAAKTTAAKASVVKSETASVKSTGKTDTPEAGENKE